jgi:tetratricopeptide (TPR) repeat protein
VEQASATLERALASQRVIFGPRSSRVLATLTDLADVRVAQGRYADAEQLIREELALTEELLGVQHYEAGYVRTFLADVLLKRGQVREAEKEGRKSLEILSSTLPADHQYIASAEYQLGMILFEKRQLSEAARKLEDSMHRWERSNAPRWRAARSESALGEVLLRMGNARDAKVHLARSYGVLQEDLGKNDPTTQAARARLERFNGSHTSSENGT